MADKNSELRVVRQSSDGRRRYDESGKRALIEAALRPGVSVARLAQEHGINANLLRKWIAKYLMEREKGIPSVSHDDEAAERDLPPAVKVIPQEDCRPRVDGVPMDIAGSHRHIPPEGSPPAFVPVVSVPLGLPPTPALPPPSMTLALHVRLVNGVEFDLGEASIDELGTVIQMLGRLACSGSTKA